MKFSTTISLALAPVALAKSAHNRYPVKRSDHVVSDFSSFGGGHGGGGVANVVQQKEVIIVLWHNQGGGAQAQTVAEQVTVTQTVVVPAGAAPTAVPGLDGVTTTVQPGSSAVIAGTGATHSVLVGGPQGLSFFPQEIKAAQGDVVLFTFMSQNHTVTQSGFDTPCDLLAGGMDTGYMPNPNNTVVPAPQVAMQVNTTEPLWMFCGQGNHCGRGMVFSINANDLKTHAQFQANAIAQRGEGLQGTALTGGQGGAPPAQAPPPAGAPPAEVSVQPEGAPPALDTSLSVDPLATSTLADIGAQPTPGAVGGAIGGGNGAVQTFGQLRPDGSCMCMFQCGVGANGVSAFPDASSQGIGAFGGTAGAISMDEINAGGVVSAVQPVQSLAVRRHR